MASPAQLGWQISPACTSFGRAHRRMTRHSKKPDWVTPSCAGKKGIGHPGGEARRAGRRGWLSETLARTVAGQGYPVHDPAEAVIVVDRVVLGAAIVPEGKRAHLPAEAAGEFRALL